MRPAARASTSPESPPSLRHKRIDGQATTRDVNRSEPAPALWRHPQSRPKGVAVLCPVCLQPADTDRFGVVKEHDDSVGHPCPMSGRVGPSWDEDTTRPAVQGRSGGICEYCSKHLAQDMHHRKSVGVGGFWHPANIIHICRTCHRFITEHPNWAWTLGL